MLTSPELHSRVLSPEPEVVQLLAIVGAGPPLWHLTPVQARAAMAAAGPMFYPPLPPVDEQRCVIAQVPVRIYRPVGIARSHLLPTLVFFHGGGWAMGDLDGYATICATLARFSNICVVLVDYRLAPESPFPAALQDATAVVDAIASDGSRLGVNQRRLAIGGDSAGANLAAVLCLQMRDSGTLAFLLQLLIYPVTDLRMEHPSYRDCAEGYLLTAELMRWYRDLYLPKNIDKSDWRVSPLGAKSHVALPRTHLVTCGLDPLQDEGRAYADKLELSGVAVSRRHYPRQIHGFLFFGRLLSSVAPALQEISDVLQSALNYDLFPIGAAR